MSRIDLILISQGLTPQLEEAAFSPRLLSDHSPYWITLGVPVDKPQRAWCLNPFWLTLLPEDDELLTEWQLFFRENDHSAPVAAVWESFKLHGRMSLTARINRMKKRTRRVPSTKR